MTDKTLTDTEMMIFACSFVANKRKLSGHPSVEKEQQILIAFQNATDDAISIRNNAEYLEDKLIQYESTNPELQILRKIQGLPPEE